MVQSLWKKNGPHWRHLLVTLPIVLNFQDDQAANSRFWTLKRARWLKITRNLIRVMHISSAVVLNYSNDDLSHDVPTKNLYVPAAAAACYCLLLKYIAHPGP